MRTTRRIAGALAALAVLACMLACGAFSGSAANQRVANDLKQLAIAYHNFHDSHARGPASAAEWNKMAASPDDKALISAVAAGEYVFYWNVKFTALTAGTATTVLGYEKQVPTAGGLVVMADGAVVTLTPQEFASAPKAEQFTKKK
jgi:hypothetical protein